MRDVSIYLHNQLFLFVNAWGVLPNPLSNPLGYRDVFFHQAVRLGLHINIGQKVDGTFLGQLVCLREVQMRDPRTTESVDEPEIPRAI